MTRLRLATAIVGTRQRTNTLRATLDRLDDGAGIATILDRAQTDTANTLAAWQYLATQDATHALLLRDDLDAAHGWRMAVSLLTTQNPTQRVISFHSTRPADREGKGRGWESVRVDEWASDQAVLMPIPIVKRYLEWVRGKHYRAYLPQDEFAQHAKLLSAFHRAHNTRYVMVAMPPLFQHAGDPEQHAPSWPDREFDAARHYRTLATREAHGQGP